MKCSICGEILTDIGDIKPDGEPICEKCNALSNTNSEEPPPVPTPEAKTFCRNHPTVEVDTKCADCGALICKTCSFPLKDENVLCQVCVQKPGANKKIPHPKPFPEGTMCSIHPGVPAELECQMCKVPICKTCCFEFPNNLHVCPNCINKPVAMSPKKRKNLI
ncbi:MAG: hypothetical protein GY757_29960, partial [bacterium]|nr:hypothetical protein [bacterium]